MRQDRRLNSQLPRAWESSMSLPPDPEFVNSIGATSCARLEDLLRESDFVSIHCPASPENRHLINHQRLACMRPDAFLINTARGDIVDESALVDALDAGGIAGAGLDVFEREPQVSADWLDRESVLLLPHLGSATVETRVAMGMRVIENLEAFFAGDVPGDNLI